MEKKEGGLKILKWHEFLTMGGGRHNILCNNKMSILAQFPTYVSSGPYLQNVMAGACTLFNVFLDTSTMIASCKYFSTLGKAIQ